jgi:putative flippase GtrA
MDRTVRRTPPPVDRDPAHEDAATRAADRQAPTPGRGPAAVPTASEAAARPGLTRRLRGAVDVVYREMVKFGAIGALAYVVDTYVYNLLRTGVWPVGDAPLAHKPLLSKVISVAVATVVAWLGNRYWTFRHRRRAAMRSEFVLFVVMNVGGLVIALGCLWFSHYALGLTSVLADNISGNLVGLVLGTLFRFWAYRQFVFTELRDPKPAADDAR